MIKRKYLIVLAVLIMGLVVSGCADKTATETGQSQTPAEEETVSAHNSNNTDIAEDALVSEMTGITDTEIQDIEEEISDIEQLINETESEEIVVEEI